MTVVGGGLAGTLVALRLRERGVAVRVVDRGRGASASLTAAGLFNPLTGPRLSPDAEGWDSLIPFYRRLEDRLGEGFVHPLTLFRPWPGTRTLRSRFPARAPGWRAEADDRGVWIQGGGWVDVPRLLAAGQARLASEGLWEDRLWTPGEGGGQAVIFCRGAADFQGPPWGGLPAMAGQAQAVRGDVLTVEVPGWNLEHAELGTFFALPVGGGKIRWGATHEPDIDDLGFRPQARQVLETALRRRLDGRPYRVVDHRWGLRPSSRHGVPLVLRHPDEAGWLLFNGFAGRGVARIPRALDQL